MVARSIKYSRRLVGVTSLKVMKTGAHKRARRRARVLLATERYEDVLYDKYELTSHDVS